MPAKNSANLMVDGPSTETPEEMERRQAAQRAAMDEVFGEEKRERVVSDDVLGDIKSFKDALSIVGSITDVESFDDYGTGFNVLDTKAKNRLVGVKFVIVEWQFNKGDQGGFVSFTCVTEDNTKYVVNDGSTGIYKQLQNVTTKRMEKGHANPQAGLMVERGLRASEYEYVALDGTRSQAVTYYLS